MCPCLGVHAGELYSCMYVFSFGNTHTCNPYISCLYETEKFYIEIYGISIVDYFRPFIVTQCTHSSSNLDDPNPGCWLLLTWWFGASLLMSARGLWSVVRQWVELNILFGVLV